MQLFPNAKINLGLLIKGKLANGYHLLETVLYPIPSLFDKMEIVESKSISLEISGITIDGNVEDNLCIKAYRKLQAQVPDLPPVHIHLEKNIPAGAGLGGGSSDAAFTLKGLNQLFSLGLSNEALANIAASLGADVPFFIYNEPMLAKGIGTELEKYPISIPYEIRLITPPIHSSTVAAYKALNYKQFDANRDLKSLLSLPFSEWKENVVNDLEVPVFNLYPGLPQIKADLYAQGAVYACMSGSGSAMFGFFPSN